jgi:PPOX class probable FMN-dependent enzyme
MNRDQDPFAQFNGVVTSLEELREQVGPPLPLAVEKVMDHIDDISRTIIETTPFIVLASASVDGYPDVSPKGDPAGFVRVLNENYLAIPDRPGNRRLDTFTNILRNPYLAILFIIPGKEETLRVTGECRIVQDQALRESMVVNGRVPEFALVVHVERVLIHCPKCMRRARLWQPEEWPDSSRTADIAEALIAQVKLDTTKEELEAEAEKKGYMKLY